MPIFIDRVLFIGGIFIIGTISSCKKNPVDRLTNPLSDGSVPQSSGTYTIYEDELKTAGDLALIPNGGNQTIDLANQEDPRRTINQIKYVWNGQDVLNNGSPQHLFAGFQLTSAGQSSGSQSGRNFSSFGYTRLVCHIRGQLSTNTAIRIEGPDDGLGGITPTQLNISSLTNNWSEVSMTIPVGDFSNIKSFITVSFQYTQPPDTTNAGEGGVVYLDDIRYEQ